MLELSKEYYLKYSAISLFFCFFFISNAVHQFDKKRSWEMMSREKPDVVKDREAEKTLQRVATRYPHMICPEKDYLNTLGCDF